MIQYDRVGPGVVTFSNRLNDKTLDVLMLKAKLELLPLVYELDDNKLFVNTINETIKTLKEYIQLMESTNERKTC